MAFPPLWGYFYWTLLHSIGKAFANHYPDAIPPEIAEALFRFMTRLCQLLPCSGCGIHCSAHVKADPPKFTRGVDVWNWFLKFHNKVNKSTNKIEYSNQEAEDALSKQLAEFGWTSGKIEEAFFQDWWSALLMTSFSMSRTPDSPTEDEKKAYREFLRDASIVMPFGFKKISPDGTLARDLMVQFCDSQKMDVSNRDKVFETIVNLHNSICDQFGRVPKTVAEFKAAFAEKFETKNTTNLIRAVQIHDEDQKKMLELQKEINELRSGKTVESDLSNNNGVSPSYQSATIALSCLLGILLLILLAAYMSYRYKLFGHWKLIRVQSDGATLRAEAYSDPDE